MGIVYSFNVKTLPPVVEPEDVIDLNAFDVLDARPANAFKAEHLKYAVRVPIEIWQEAAKNPATGLDNLKFWHGEISALSVSGSRPVLIYDDGRRPA